ncbi:MAG: hypothetical protein ACLQVJ_10445 [Syntrophobacteraceae bacterium]
MTKYATHRDRLRDECVAVSALLSERDRIPVSEITQTLKMRTFTVRRWLNSFSRAMDLRIEKGVVIIERI